jgi:uncharacterized protein (TIGR03435 family)
MLAAVIGVAGLMTAPLKPQTAARAVPAWQIAAGRKMEFEVASIKRGAIVQPSFPLDDSDAFTPTGGRFVANFPLDVYITFAYKTSPTWDQRQAMLAHLPGWVGTDRYTIEAKAPGNTTKDQFRLMVQSLLADRFKLAIHFETQQVPLLALTLAKPGKVGPNLRPHADGPPCNAVAVSPANAADVFPSTCFGYAMSATPNHARLRTGARNTTMPLLAAHLPNLIVPAQGSVLEPTVRPVVDQTGLDGNFDVLIEWSPESKVPGFEVEPDPVGPTFLDAMRDQLGLKLNPTRGPIQILVIDHVERPTEN